MVRITFIILFAALLALVEATTTQQQRRAPREGTSVRITKRAHERALSGADLHAWAQAERRALRLKYGMLSDVERRSNDQVRVAKRQASKRAVGASDLINIARDSSWVAAFSVGTPAQQVNLVIDTGSSDIWIGEENVSRAWDPLSSSSFVNDSKPFSIEYGSGSVAGVLATDSFTLAGHTSPKQTFALATQVSQDLLSSGVQGIAGLGFKSLSTAGADPWWTNIGLDSGSEEFSFYLARQVDAPVSASTSYGGVFTVGGVNSSLYQGSINWVDVTQKNYWLVNLGGVSVQGSTVELGSTTKAAIDTGTTLIGGPDAVIKALYAQIPGAKASTTSPGYYEYACSTDVNATMTFGNQQYSIRSQDFLAGTSDRSGDTCLGAFFSVGSNQSNTLQWIVGAAFLKQVYSIFQNGDTARVGFASLASNLNDGTSSVAVEGAVSSGTSSGSSSTSSSSPSAASKPAPALAAGLALLSVGAALQVLF